MLSIHLLEINAMMRMEPCLNTNMPQAGFDPELFPPFGVQ